MGTGSWEWCLPWGRWGVPGSSSQGIFLCYRREDSAPYALLLRSKLRERFPAAPVFMDLDSIEGGQPFAEVIREALDSCAVLVALIGRQWVTLADGEGQRRLDDPADFVRFEVQTALARRVQVIPVLIDGASPPRRQQLPSELQELAGLNALELTYGRYEYDAGRLLDLIQRVLTKIRDQEEADRKAEAERQAREVEAREARHAQILQDKPLTTLTNAGDRTRLNVLAQSLIVQVGDQNYSLVGDITVGRQGELAIDDGNASILHARFRAAHGMWFVEDLDSTNGTWLNGRRIRSPQRLKKGDEITIGHTVLTVLSDV
jgi:hypothetical protein